jgi:hypothetical protein
MRKIETALNAPVDAQSQSRPLKRAWNTDFIAFVLA